MHFKIEDNLSLFISFLEIVFYFYFARALAEVTNALLDIHIYFTARIMMLLLYLHRNKSNQ